MHMMIVQTRGYIDISGVWCARTIRVHRAISSGGVVVLNARVGGFLYLDFSFKW